MSNYSNEANPFAAPQISTGNKLRRPSSKSGLPTFCLVMFIVSLVFCVLRLMMVVLGFIGWSALTQANPNDPLLATVLFEIGAGAAMAFFGIVGNSLLLAKKPIGVVFGWGLVAATLVSIGVGVWQLSIMAEAYPDGSPERVGAYIGGGVMVLIRLTILILFGVALMRFGRWAKENNL